MTTPAESHGGDRLREDLSYAIGCLTSLMTVSMDGVIVCDDAFRVMLINPSAERLFAMTADAVRGRPVLDLLPQLELGLPTDPVTMPARRADETSFAAEVAAVVHRIDTETLTCVVVRDVSERTALEAQLRQAQKMDALGQLAGGVAHDFNNLLTVIFGNLDLARREVRDRPSAVELLGEVERASSRAAELTRQLLSFSRKRVLEHRLVSVDNVVRSAERLFRRVLPESVVLETSLGAEPVATRTDPGQLEQALMNLIVNSRDALPAGGTIVIETGVVTLTPERAHHYPELTPGRYVTLIVRDSGRGMTDDVRQRIFEPFFTTKAVGQGTGLGLTMVYGIVTQSGGAVRVDSTPGRGTSFTMFLPAADGAAAAEPPRPTAPHRGTETIMLVEDESAVRASTRRMLERSGYTVLEARHGGDALALWRAERGRIALIISDVRMPMMGGAELVREVRRESDSVRFLLMSGYAELDASPALADLSVPFIEKPFTVDSLLRRVREVLDEPIPTN